MIRPLTTAIASYRSLVVSLSTAIPLVPAALADTPYPAAEAASTQARNAPIRRHATRRVYVDEPPLTASSVLSFAHSDNDAEVARTVVSQEAARSETITNTR